MPDTARTVKRLGSLAAKLHPYISTWDDVLKYRVLILQVDPAKAGSGDVLTNQSGN